MRGSPALTLGMAALVSLPILAQSGYVPHRVYSSAERQFVDVETMSAELSRADVVFIGEQHNDVNTHRLQRALLESLARRRGEIILAFEMFERDVQAPIDRFLMGQTSEAELLSEVRPWPQYARDYKPLIDSAVANAWPVVAANVPRTIAAEVSASGLDVLKARPEKDRKLFAADVRCSTSGRYFERFRDVMRGGHGGGSTPELDRVTLERYFEAQCLKDETMAESIAQAYAAGAAGGKRPLVLSINGVFHSDFGGALVESTRRRLTDKRIVVVSVLPVENLDVVAPDESERGRADYLVFTLK